MMCLKESVSLEASCPGAAGSPAEGPGLNKPAHLWSRAGDLGTAGTDPARGSEAAPGLIGEQPFSQVS